MVNERKTEDIIRDILKRNKEIYEKETKQSVIIEEQKSDNPRIAKLLLTASKAGLGAAYVTPHTLNLSAHATQTSPNELTMH